MINKYKINEKDILHWDCWKKKDFKAKIFLIKTVTLGKRSVNF